MSSETQRQRYAGTRTALVGVDAGKFHHVLAVRPRDGDNSKALKFAVTREGFDQAAAFIRKAAGGADPAEILVGIEFAGNCGFTLAQYLGQLGYEVVSIRPVDTKNQKRTTHRRAVKTDAKDAETILSLLFQGAWVYFPFRDPEYAALRYLLSAVDRVTSQRSGVATRVRWALQVAFPELEAILGSQSFTKHQTPLALLDAFPGPQALLAASREEVLAVVSKASRGKLKDEFADRLIAAAESTLALQVAQDPIGRELRLLVAQLRFLGDQLDQLQELVLETLQLIPESVYVMSVPGVGPMTAAMFFGSLGDVRAYESARQAVAMAGMGLTEASSGTVTGKKRISKEGRAVMRRYLFLLVIRLITKSGPYRPRYEQLRAKGKLHRVAVVAIARALLKVMFAVARKQEMFDPAKLGSSLTGPADE